jgi:hypothetical protein
MKEVLPLMKISFRIRAGGIASVTTGARSCSVWPSGIVFLLVKKLEGVKSKEEDKRRAG